MPSGTAVPPQVAIAAGPLSVAILLADLAGDAVEAAQPGAELMCVLRTTSAASMLCDVEIRVTAEGGLSFGDHMVQASIFHVTPGVVHVTEFPLKASESGQGILTFELRYRVSGHPMWSIWRVGGPIAVDIQ
jgi:hypothetical protein